MATRYLTALDYSDVHSSAVLRKHAKKRPLGELESRYQYTPPQPVLSCRTVDIDVSGTRTYRPRSTADILDEQQKLIRRLFTSGRSATSAPPRRTPRKGLGLVINGALPTARSKIHVQGRPCTSMSQASSEPAHTGKSTPNGQRPRTTGRLKNVKSATDSYMDQDSEGMLQTRRSHNQLTNQIHAHWRPDSSNLNKGHFMRGQKRPDDVLPTLDAWLTFGGTAGEETGGVVDAFASFESAEDYYNIEGTVGSRVAEQLQKGDKIRIGINGEIFSHDLKIKKWVKGDPSSEGGDRGGQSREEEEQQRTEEERDPIQGGSHRKPSVAANTDDDMFGDMLFESLEDIVEKKEEDAEGKENAESKRSKTLMDFPLSWDDQVSRPEVKVISARTTPRDSDRETMSETQPVVFNRVVRTSQPRPKLASTPATNGYRIKQRSLNGKGDNRLDSAGSKVKAISFDAASPEAEQRLNDLSVDDVIQKRLEKNGSSPRSGSAALPPGSSRLKPRSSSRKSQEEDSAASGEGLPKAMMDHKSKEKHNKRSVSAMSKSSAISFGGGESHVLPDGKSRKASSSSSSSSSRPLAVHRPSSSVPVKGTRDMDLGIVTPAVSSVNQRTDRQVIDKGNRHQSGIASHRGLGNGVSSINAGPIAGETEFIQISQPIRNPNSLASMSSGMRSSYSPYPMNSPTNLLPPHSPPRSNTPENGLGGQSLTGSPRTVTPTNMRSPAPSPNPPSPIQTVQEVPNSDINLDLNLSGRGSPSGSVAEDVTRNAPTPVSDADIQPSTNGKAISIPTGDRLEDEDEIELTAAQRRERSLRDQHIDQITDLLVGAILSEDQK